MNKKIGKGSGSEIPGGLKGFEDIFEDYVKSEENRDTERREKENSRIGEQHELQHFLEQENARLSGLETFFTKKIPLKVNFSQTPKLTLVQMERKSFLREKLSDSLTRLDSDLQKNLAHLMNSHFS